MKPVEFDGFNMVYGREQEQYLNLPAREEGGMVTSCWQMGWRERLKALWTGRVWVEVLTFGEPLQPLKVRVNAGPGTRLGNVPGIGAQGKG